MNGSTNWNTGSGPETSLIELVTTGMTVVDLAGEKVGQVEYVQMGDPRAVTTEGNQLDDPGLIGQLGMAVAGDEREPDVPEPKRSQLLRCGFIKVDGPGITDTDRYVRSDLLGALSGDTVTLSVTRDRLPTES